MIQNLNFSDHTFSLNFLKYLFWSANNLLNYTYKLFKSGPKTRQNRPQQLNPKKNYEKIKTSNPVILITHIQIIFFIKRSLSRISKYIEIDPRIFQKRFWPAMTRPSVRCCTVLYSAVQCCTVLYSGVL